MSRYNKLGKNMIWMTVGNFASKLLSFFLIPLYTSVLTTEEYGISDLIATTVTLLAPVLTLQINEAVMRFSLDNNVDKKQTLSCGIFTIIGGFFVLLLLTPLLFLIQSVKQFYLLFLLYYLGTTINTLFAQYAKGIELVHHYAISGIIHTASVISCNILFLIVFKLGIKGYILSLVIGSVISLLYLFVSGKYYKNLLKAKSINILTYKSMLKYSIPMIPNSLSWWISNSSDKYMLNYITDTSSVGVYSISYKIPSLLSTVNTIFMSAWQISAVEDFGSRQSADFFSDMYKKLTALDALVVSMLVVFSKFLAKFLYINEFFDAWKYAAILCFAFYFSSLSSFLGSIYTSSKRTNALFYTSLIGAISNIVLNLILIHRYYAYGAAIATLISYMIVWLFRFFHVNKVFEFEKKMISNIISGSAILLQIIFVYIENTVFNILSFAILILLAIYYRNFISDTMLMIKNKLLKHR
ncbi:oligosaccharide flippase family protein [Ruminococcus flavefaciens]|uniref:oligosaccharide flippase family protein n=1 Tax=Ruminococcus flavefaciens TaxID=1265 RepID=UPI0002E3A471|nr:oligosaccharide flippase family protein [Ruminococcus flavefaciens]